MRANAHGVFIVIGFCPMPCVGVKAALLQHGLGKGLLLDGVKLKAVENFVQQRGFGRAKPCGVLFNHAAIIGMVDFIKHGIPNGWAA